MITSRPQDELAFSRNNHLIQLGIGRINSLKRVAVRLVELVEVDFFEFGFKQTTGGIHSMDIVLVRRVRAPVPRGRIDLHCDEAMAVEAGGENGVNLAR